MATFCLTRVLLRARLGAFVESGHAFFLPSCPGIMSNARQEGCKQFSCASLPLRAAVSDGGLVLCRPGRGKRRKGILRERLGYNRQGTRCLRRGVPVVGGGQTLQWRSSERTTGYVEWCRRVRGEPDRGVYRGRC